MRIPAVTISQASENWEALSQRLRGRGDFLLNGGRIKDAELMFDAATEIELLREQIKRAAKAFSEGK